MQLDDYGYEGAVSANAYDDARAEVKRLEARWAALRAWLEGLRCWGLRDPRVDASVTVLAKMDELEREVAP